MMLKPRCSRCSGWGRVSSTQESTHQSVKDLGDFRCVFDGKDIVQHLFVPRSQMINKQIYQEVLARLREVVRRKRLQLWEKQKWILHHNAPAHASFLIRVYLAKHQISVSPNPPYSPDLHPEDL
jgi:hypothetical protein